MILRRTPFDVFIAAFVVTAVIGVWASYDSMRAAIKLGNIVVAVVVFYVLAGQRRRNIWMVSGVLGLFGSAIALYFLTTHDWYAWPADLKLLTNVGLLLMRIRPPFPFPAIHPNVAGGLIALLFPFQIAFSLSIFLRKKREFYAAAAILIMVTSVGLLLTSSRMAWLSLVMASALCFLWIIIPRFGLDVRVPRWPIYLLFIGFVFIVGVGLIVLLNGQLPSAGSSGSRLKLFRDTLDLIVDFPFTGGGLAAFPGLYSQYIAVTPFIQFNYSHNMWLDMILEQGVPGLLAFIWIIAGSVLLLWRTITRVPTAQLSADNETVIAFRQELNLFRWAIVVGLLTMIGHGFTDDAIYGNLGTPLLFFLPGMAVAVSRKRELSWLQAVSDWKLYAAWGVAVVVIMIAPYMIGGHSFVADWAANRGALMMAQSELRGWPTGQWNDGDNIGELALTAPIFQRVVAIDAGNRTAHHRLGLLAMLHQDFDASVVHLEVANEIDPRHRGIAKALGYSYIWQGDINSAIPILMAYPEAEDELDAYTWWWKTQGRDDLAVQANIALAELKR